MEEDSEDEGAMEFEDVAEADREAENEDEIVGFKDADADID